MSTSTSSFRIESELKLRLELAAKSANRGKNWIVNQALSEYLTRNGQEDLKAEARRQSLEAARLSAESEIWERAAVEAWHK